MIEKNHLSGKSDQPSLPSRILGTAKHVTDFASALTVLVLCAPLLLVVALLVKLTSRGPVFYTQLRVGLSGKLYSIYKIRTMVHDCEKNSGPLWSTSGDSRITWFGKFLRRSHLDELPQLLNVLRGEMSLVGPRPERPEFVPALERALPRYRERLRVRPGLTGLAQVQLPPDTDIHSVRRKLAHDLHYADNLGLWLDCKILFGTIFHVLGLPGSTTRLILRLPGGEMVETAYATPITEHVQITPVPQRKARAEEAAESELQPA